MTKLKLILAAAVSVSILASPAMARKHVAGPPAQSVYCATRTPGNPHSQYCDFIAWAKWKERGGWDSTLDNACYHNPAFVPGECGLDPANRRPLGANSF